MSNNINLNMAGQNDSDSNLYTEKEFNDTYVSKGLVVVEDEGLQRFVNDINALIKKGESGGLYPDQIDSIEKAKRDITKLVRKRVTDKNGKVVTKWVKMEDADANVRKRETGTAVTKVDTDAAKEFTAKKARDAQNFKAGQVVKITSILASHSSVNGKTFKVDTVTTSPLASGSKTFVHVTHDGETYEIPSGFVKRLSPTEEAAWLDQEKVAGGSLVTPGMLKRKESADKNVHNEAWDRHQHNMKVQRQGKEASLKNIETKYGKDVADKVRERHEAPVKAAEKKSDLGNNPSTSSKDKSSDKSKDALAVELKSIKAWYDDAVEDMTSKLDDKGFNKNSSHYKVGLETLNTIKEYREKLVKSPIKDIDLTYSYEISKEGQTIGTIYAYDDQVINKFEDDYKAYKKKYEHGADKKSFVSYKLAEMTNPILGLKRTGEGGYSYTGVRTGFSIYKYSG